MAGEQPTTKNIDPMDEEEAQQELAHQWNCFESLMIQKMDAILHLHQEHQAEVHVLVCVVLWSFYHVMFCLS